MRGSSVVRRLGWSVGSQIASSLSNLGLSVVVARSVQLEELGLFAILMATFNVAVGVVRAFGVEPLVYGEKTSRLVIDPYSSAFSGALLVTSGVVLLPVAPLLLMGVDVWTVVAFGFAMPFALLQDAVRFELNACRRARTAFVGELVWILAQFSTMFFLGSRGSIAPLVGFWGFGAFCSLVFGITCMKLRPRFGIALEWLRSTGKVGLAYAGDFCVSSGLNYVAVFVLVFSSGYSAAGELRAAQILATPLMIFTLGVSFAVAPEAARAARSGRLRTLSLLPWVYGGGVFAAGGVTVVVANLFPDSVMKSLVGDSGSEAQSLLPFVVLTVCLLGSSVGSGLVLRVLGEVRKSLAIKVAIAPFTLVAVWILSTMQGAVGSQLGLSSGNIVRTACSGLYVRKSLRRLGADGPVLDREDASETKS